MLEIGILIQWLGPAGAKAGLQASELSLRELVELAKRRKLPLSPKPTREEVANELVFANSKRIDRDIDLLLSMKQDDLVKYFKKTKPSRSELIKLLSDLGVSVGSEASKNLVKFSAREISDLGMYQRVARGSRGDNRKTKV